MATAQESSQAEAALHETEIGARERPSPQTPDEIRRSANALAASFSLVAVAAMATIALAIIGLSGAASAALASVATIVVGSALLLKAGSTASRYRPLVIQTADTFPAELELRAGMLAELVGGAVGIALGIIALSGVVPAILTACAVIVFGAALLLGGGETYRVNRLPDPARPTEPHQVGALNKSAAVLESAAGIGAITLGIIALAGAGSHRTGAGCLADDWQRSVTDRSRNESTQGASRWRVNDIG